VVRELSELDRIPGAKITLTLDNDAEAPSGFLDGVEAAGPTGS
jgi:hypothetical protein